MTLFDLLRRFLFHLSVAGTVLIVVLLLGETFVPGSVLPLLNVVDAIPILVILVVLFVALSRRPES
jgi:hypothetical protein